MKTFEQWRHESETTGDSDGLYGDNDLEAAWDFCASQYEHLLKNKDTAIQLNNDTIKALRKQVEELKKDLDYASGFFHDHLIDSPGFDFGILVELNEIRLRHKLDGVKV
jgi:hypothetical protein